MLHPPSPLAALTRVLLLACGALATRLAADEWSDPPAPLTPLAARSEEELDRVAAHATYMRARALFGQGEFAAALREHQRAWRLDPQAQPLLEQIVPLAFALKRPLEAARYAVLAAERDPRDPVLLRRLALLLAEQNQPRRALRLLDHALRLRGAAPRDEDHVLLQLERGRLALEVEDYPAAAEALAVVRAALERPEKFGVSARTRELLFAKPGPLCLLMFESCLQVGQWDEAAGLLPRAFPGEDQAGERAWYGARLAVRQDRFAQALRRLEEYAATGSTAGGLEVYALWRDALRQSLGDQAAADRQLRERLAALWAAQGDNAPLGLFLGRELAAAGDHAGAAKVFEAVLAKRPARECFLGLLASRRAQGDVDAWLAALGRALTLDSVWSPWFEVFDEAAADKAFQTALLARVAERLAADAASADTGQAEPPRDGEEPGDASRPEERVARWGRGPALAAAVAALWAGKVDLAERCFARAASEADAPLAEWLPAWGLALSQRQEYARSAAVFQRLLDEKIAPERATQFYFSMAGALVLAGEVEKAAAAAQRGAALAPASLELADRVPWIWHQGERYEEARRGYLALLPRYDADHESEALRAAALECRLALSHVALRLGRADEAEEWLEQALDEHPEHAGALNDLGYLWANAGRRLGRALRMTQAAAAAEPDNAAYRDSLGWVYYRLGRPADAVRELERAASLAAEPDGVILDHLGDAHALAGQRGEALRAWRRAAAAFQKEKEADKLKAVEAKIHQAEP